MTKYDLFKAMGHADAEQIAAALGEIAEPAEAVPAEKPVQLKPDKGMNPVWRWVLTAGCAAACIGSAVLLIHLIPKNDYTYMQQSVAENDFTRELNQPQTTTAPQQTDATAEAVRTQTSDTHTDPPQTKPSDSAAVSLTETRTTAKQSEITHTTRETTVSTTQTTKQTAKETTASSPEPKQTEIIPKKPAMIDLEQYIREHMTEPLHLLDPQGWYAGEITRKPDYSKYEGVVTLYSDELTPEELKKNRVTGLYSGAFVSVIILTLDDPQSAAADAVYAELDRVLGGYADTRDTLEYGRAYYASLMDYALQADFPDRVMSLLNAKPELLNGISKIVYKQAAFGGKTPQTGGSVHFLMENRMNEVKAMIEEEHLPWIWTDRNGLTCETAEELHHMIVTVTERFGFPLKESTLAAVTSLPQIINEEQILYTRAE